MLGYRAFPPRQRRTGGPVLYSDADCDSSLRAYTSGCGPAGGQYSDVIGALVKNAGEQNRTLALLLEADCTLGRRRPADRRVMFQLIYTAIRTLAIGHALKKAGADPIQQAADIVDSAKEDPGGFIVDVFDGIRKLIILAVCLFIGFLLLVQGIQSLDEHLHGTDQPSPAPMIIVAVILVGTCVVLFVYSSTAPHSPARTVRQDEKTPEDYDVLGLECLLCRNYETAVKWFHLAAERGLARSQLNLGNRYALGQGVKQDYVEAASGSA